MHHKNEEILNIGLPLALPLEKTGHLLGGISDKTITRLIHRGHLRRFMEGNVDRVLIATASIYDFAQHPIIAAEQLLYSINQAANMMGGVSSKTIRRLIYAHVLERLEIQGLDRVLIKAQSIHRT